MRPVMALGLMSGTSLDGVDVAILHTDGERVDRFGPWRTQPYDDAMRARLRDGLRLAARQGVAARQAPELLDLARDVTRLHGQAVQALLRQEGIAPEEIAVAGFHGQTVLHRPEQGLTVQLGDGAALADQLGIDVVYDFRSADVAAGGQGAPLAPLYHLGLARGLKQAAFPGGGPVAVLNIGGIANITWIDARRDPAEGGLLAFDTGPGNCLIDDWCLRKTGAGMDKDGVLAAQGRADAAVLQALMHSADLHAPPPKSFDRLDFDPSPVEKLTAEDGAATLTAFTAAAIAASRAHLPAAPACWILCGGGRRNPVLLEMLRQQLGVRVLTAEEAGWRGDAIEAEAFAFLAVRSLRGLPLSLPATTGAPRPLTGGVLAGRMTG
ncbi:MAG: anhydro-N-acetylmuramic acid kinase [Pseudomonadota bacterium]